LILPDGAESEVPEEVQTGLLESERINEFQLSKLFFDTYYCIDSSL